MSDVAGEQVEAWRERRRGLGAAARALRAGDRPALRAAWSSCSTLGPGSTVLELAAGPGETGFLAARSDPARRRAALDRRRARDGRGRASPRGAELGLDDVAFAVEDAAGSRLADDVRRRRPLPLRADARPRHGDARRARSRASSVPAGAAVLAVWAERATVNAWMTAPGRAALELGLVDRPDPDAPGPFRLARKARSRICSRGAGLRVETVEDVSVTWRASSLAAWWEVARDTSRSLALILESATADDAEAIRTGAERRLERYVRPDGSLAVPGRTHVALARRPA